MAEQISKYRPDGLAESREVPLSMRAWLGGAFEVGGGIHYDIRRKTKTSKQYPSLCLQLTDSEPIISDKLYEIFSGYTRINYVDGNSFRWILTGHKAVPVATSMALFTPSRREMIDLIEEVEQVKAIDGKINAIKQFRGSHLEGRNPVTPEDYLDLLENPEWVAGAIDLRGVIDSNRGPRLRVHTSNVPLIDAFVEIFDGERKIWTEAGTEVEILNRNYTLKRDRAAWELRGSAVKDFCAYVTPYLLRGKVKGIEKLI